jgi:nucleolar protein 14
MKDKEKEKKDDDYDRLVRQMMFEPRAQPSNPLLTPEQIAKAEQERLEQLEVIIYIPFRIYHGHFSFTERLYIYNKFSSSFISLSLSLSLLSKAARLRRMNTENTEESQSESEHKQQKKKISADDLGDEDYMNILGPPEEDMSVNEENDIGSFFRSLILSSDYHFYFRSSFR